MKYIERHFCLRIHRRDGTSKLLLGVTGHPPKIGSLKQIKVTHRSDRGMTTRRFPPPWRVEQIPGGYKVKEANGQSLAYVYGRETRAAADIAHVLS